MSSYRERPIHPALRSRVDAVWIVEHAPGGPVEGKRIMPDGCIDLLRRPGQGVQVAGPSTTAFDVAVRPGDAYFGVRFSPGAAEAVLGARADSLRDETTNLDGLWSARAAHRLGVSAEPRSGDDPDDIEASLERFQVQLAAMIGDRPDTDPVVEAAVDRIRVGDGRVAGLGQELGISDRQLRRRFDQAVGYGPKQLARVVRFQRAWSMALDAAATGAPVAWATIAAMAGYADQSHLVNDFGDLGGATPTRLVEAVAAEDVRFVQARDGEALVSSQA